jgi:hypothetical protein
MAEVSDEGGHLRSEQPLPLVRSAATEYAQRLGSGSDEIALPGTAATTEFQGAAKKRITAEYLSKKRFAGLSEFFFLLRIDKQNIQVLMSAKKI